MRCGREMPSKGKLIKENSTEVKSKLMTTNVFFFSIWVLYYKTLLIEIQGRWGGGMTSLWVFGHVAWGPSTLINAIPRNYQSDLDLFFLGWLLEKVNWTTIRMRIFFSIMNSISPFSLFYLLSPHVCCDVNNISQLNLVPEKWKIKVRFNMCAVSNTPKTARKVWLIKPEQHEFFSMMIEIDEANDEGLQICS